MVVLGATDLEAGMKADVAPSSDPVILASSQAKQAHVSKLSKERKTKKTTTSKLGKGKSKKRSIKTLLSLWKIKIKEEYLMILQEIFTKVRIWMFPLICEEE